MANRSYRCNIDHLRRINVDHLRNYSYYIIYTADSVKREQDFGSDHTIDSV